MKNIFLTLGAAAVLAGSVAPAAMAQSYRGEYRQDYRGPGVVGRPTANLDRLDWRIDNAARDGRISRFEARQLRAELRDAKAIAWRLQSGRAGRFEARRLDQIVDHIRVATSGDLRYGRNDRRFGY